MQRASSVLAVLFATAGILRAQAPPGDVASGPVIELSEAALAAYEAADWQRLHTFFAPDLQRGGTPETMKMRVEALEQVLRRHAVRFEQGLGRLELRLCLQANTWGLRTLAVIPDSIVLAEYILTDLLPQQSEIEMMFAHCGQDGVPEGVGEMQCVGITAAGETLAIVMKISGPGQVEIANATIAAEASPDPTREVLEPVARGLLDRYSRRAAAEIRESATPGFREAVDLALLVGSNRV